LDEAAVRQPSYADEWTIAQVCSHLGSAAEIGRQWLQAAVEHGEAIGGDDLPPIWDAWNSRPPAAQVADAVAADEAYVSDYERLDEGQLADAHVSLFGGFMEVDGAGLARLRLFEHTM